MNDSDYQRKLEEIFVRFPSVQNTGFGEAYKPGLKHMEEFDSLLGNPSKDFKSIHVAGTNGKGSVANMLASAIAATGLKVGLYTSPHILDFRERMRILDGRTGEPVYLISRENVWDFLSRREKSFDELELSFFEITTGMAFWWFSKEKLDVAVIEVGLGGRLDSTNIITPEVAVVTSIGLDHCAQLGDTRAAIAGEKAGIFKPGVPAVVGTRDEETAPVFEATAAAVGCPLVFADSEAGLEDCLEKLPSVMDLQGEWQKENLRTVLTVMSVLRIELSDTVLQAIAHTADRMDFHGRWEMLRRNPDIICDIGHNPPALARNFAQLEAYLTEGRYDRLIIVYGVMADKDLDGILPLMPRSAEYIAVAPNTSRSMKAETLFNKLSAALPGRVSFGGTVSEGLQLAFGLAVGPSAAICSASQASHADPFRANAAEGPQPILHTINPASQASHADPFRANAAEGPQPILHTINPASQASNAVPSLNCSKPLVYIGGSTFVVSEAVIALSTHRP